MSTGPRADQLLTVYTVVVGLQGPTSNDCMAELHDVNPGIAWINDVVSNRQRRVVYTTSFIVAFAGVRYLRPARARPTANSFHGRRASDADRRTRNMSVRHDAVSVDGAHPSRRAESLTTRVMNNRRPIVDSKLPSVLLFFQHSLNGPMRCSVRRR